MSQTNYLLDEWLELVETTNATHSSGVMDATKARPKRISVAEALGYREMMPPNPLEMTTAFNATATAKEYRLRSETKYVQIPVELAGSDSHFVTRRVPFDRVLINNALVTAVEDHGDYAVLDLWSRNQYRRIGESFLCGGDFHIVCDRGYHSLTSERSFVVLRTDDSIGRVHILFNDVVSGVKYDTPTLRPRRDAWSPMLQLVVPLFYHRSCTSVVHAVYSPVTDLHNVTFVFHKFVMKPPTSRTAVGAALATNHATIHV